MMFRRKRKPAAQPVEPVKPIQHVTTTFEAHGLTVVVCLCGWERPISSPARALELAQENEAHHAH